MMKLDEKSIKLPRMVIVFFAVVVLSIEAFAQGGIVKGVFRDSNNAVVPGVKTEIRALDSNELIRSVLSDESGEFSFQLPVGKYSFFASANGFENVVFPTVDLQPNSTLLLDLRLTIDEKTILACPGFDTSAVLVTTTSNKDLDGLTVTQSPKVEFPVLTDTGKAKKVRKNKQK